jgi:hypothetical protein
MPVLKNYVHEVDFVRTAIGKYKVMSVPFPKCSFDVEAYGTGCGNIFRDVESLRELLLRTGIGAYSKSFLKISSCSS